MHTDFSATYNVGAQDTALRQTLEDGVTGQIIDYDAFGRLTAATTTTGAGHDYIYGYDSAGNRTSATVTGHTTTFSYNDANQLTSGPTMPVYDGAGNETTGPDGRTATYNARNQTAIASDNGASLSFGCVDTDSTRRTEVNDTCYTNSALGVATERTDTAAIESRRFSPVTVLTSLFATVRVTPCPLRREPED